MPTVTEIASFGHIDLDEEIEKKLEALLIAGKAYLKNATDVVFEEDNELVDLYLKVWVSTMHDGTYSVQENQDTMKMILTQLQYCY